MFTGDESGLKARYFILEVNFLSVRIGELTRKSG
jgi:hypothetical protein